MPMKKGYQYVYMFLSDGYGLHISSGPNIHEVKWDTDMHGVFTRKLVNESRGNFIIKTCGS